MLTLSEIVYHTKHCPKCDQIKTRDEFAVDKRKRMGLQGSCRQCQLIVNRHYKHSDHGRERINKTRRERYTSDPKDKMTRILRARLSQALKRAKHGKAVKRLCTLDILGCKMDFFMQHIEQQFQDGMTWENHGQWHIDHILPCASFDLTNAEEQKTCFNFSNMTPLWAEDNLKKGCRPCPRLRRARAAPAATPGFRRV